MDKLLAQPRYRAASKVNKVSCLIYLILHIAEIFLWVKYSFGFNDCSVLVGICVTMIFLWSFHLFGFNFLLPLPIAVSWPLKLSIGFFSAKRDCVSIVLFKIYWINSTVVIYRNAKRSVLSTMSIWPLARDYI